MLKNVKKFVSLVLVLALSFVVCVPAFAAAPAQNIALDDLSIEMSVADLQQGATVVVEEDTNGNLTISSPTEAFALENGRSTRAVVATFHCGITYDKNSNSAYLHWNATGERLTRVTAKIFCKSTSILFPKSYFNDDIDGYSDLSGRYNSASGATDSFDIPSGTTKVKVGWSSAYVTTVAKGKMSMASASQTVTLK
jgi:hypothetical protein